MKKGGKKIRTPGDRVSGRPFPAAKTRCREAVPMDKRQKQVFRLVTLLPAFPAAASGTRGEQVLRLTAAGPLPDLTGFPMKLVAALLPAQDGKRCLTCQHRVFVSILQHFEIIVKNYKSAPKQAICQSPRQFWAGGIFESADHSACVVFHNLPPCRSPFSA